MEDVKSQLLPSQQLFGKPKKKYIPPEKFAEEQINLEEIVKEEKKAENEKKKQEKQKRSESKKKKNLDFIAEDLLLEQNKFNRYGTYTFSGENISRILFSDMQIYNYLYYQNIFESKKKVSKEKTLVNGDLFYKRIDKNGNISKHDSLQICDCGLMRTHGARRNQLHFQNNEQCLKLCYSKIKECLICHKKPENNLNFKITEFYEHLKNYHMYFVLDFKILTLAIIKFKLTYGYDRWYKFIDDLKNSETSICYFILRFPIKLREMLQIYIKSCGQYQIMETGEQFQENIKNKEKVTDYFTNPFEFGYTTLHDDSQFKIKRQQTENSEISLNKKIVKNDSTINTIEQPTTRTIKSNYKNNGESLSNKLFCEKKIFNKKHFERIVEQFSQNRIIYFYNCQSYGTFTEAGIQRQSNKQIKAYSSISQQICECGFMRVNAVKRHFKEHFSDFQCLNNKHKKINFNKCEICGQKSIGQTYKFSELYDHLKQHYAMNDMMEKQKIVKFPIFDFEQLYDFYTKGEICIMSKYITLGTDEYDECEYIHIKVKQIGFEWIQQNTNLVKNS